MEITNLFNFDGDANRVDRGLVAFLQRINDSMDFAIYNNSTGELLYSANVGDYLDAPYEENSYDDWNVIRVYISDNLLQLYISPR